MPFPPTPGTGAQIEFEDVSYSVRVPSAGAGVENMGTAFRGLFTPKDTVPLNVLSSCSGVLAPGTLTLVRPFRAPAVPCAACST